ncbi:MAG: glycosyltransferase family 2 protein, partial [Candidatus Hydrogenedentes bacterium]|nr:glycosyltransferase family 2 protein [Candidatus Hydrogenedentota bacterium]
MSTPRISILMPVHNAEDTLVEAIESICVQTFSDWELIIVDDGSSDASREILHTYEKRDSRICGITRERCGIVEALMTAASAARAPLLARMDADDISVAMRLESQITLFDHIPDLALCGTRVRMFGTSLGSGRKRYASWINSL